MTKILATGCAGFVGSHLIESLLRKGYIVIGIDCFTDYYPRQIKEANISSALENKNFELIRENISNMKNFPKVDYVFHLAAQPGVRASWGKNFEIYLRNNVLATQKLFEFYKNFKIKKFVYASSSSVYGDVELPMRENSLLKPISPYGVTKLAGENLCYLYYKNYEVPIVSLRYFTVYGPRQRPDMAIYRFTKALLKGEEITVYGDGTQTRDFTYVEDVVEATIMAAESNLVGEVLNIGGGSRTSVNELIGIMEGTIERRTKVKYSETQKGDVRHTWADISKAERLLGWKPKTSLEQGLLRTIMWFQGKSA